MKQFFLKNEKKISRAAIIIIFLALVRSLAEPFRLQYLSDTQIILEQTKPFLISGLITSIGLLVMTILSFYNKHKIIVVISILIIISLLFVKAIYLD